MFPTPRRALAATGLAVLLTAAAGAPAEARPDRAAGQDALREVRAIQAGREDPAELSRALRDLSVNRAALGRRERRAAAGILARPTDQATAEGDLEYQSDEAEPLCSARFCIHYVDNPDDPDAPDLTDDPSDADDTPEYVERVLEVFEEVYDRENGAEPDGLAWPASPPDEGIGGGNQLDVYLANIGADGTYGYVSPDDDQQGIHQHSFQVMDDDYEEFDGDDSLQVTAAHEYNHVLQNGINAGLDAWMFEATATWMEDQVYPAINDYYQYLASWAAAPGTPLTTFQSDGGTYQYGSAVWNHYLSGTFDATVVRDAWTGSVAGEDALSAYDRAIPDGGFASGFTGFVAAASEWRSGTDPFVDGPAYPDLTRSGAFGFGAAPQTVALDHASFGVFDVTDAPGGSSIRLRATFPEGVDGGVALVARTPGDPVGLVSQTALIPGGGAVSVQLEVPAGADRVTAVLANTDRDHGAFDPDEQAFPYTADGAEVSADVVAGEAPDTVAPETTIDSGPQGTIEATEATFAFSASEAGARFECALDGGTFGGCTSPVTYTGLSTGAHSVAVRATDAAGNVDATPATRAFEVKPKPAATATPSPTPAATPVATATPAPTVVPTPEPKPDPTADLTAPDVRVRVAGKARKRVVRLRVACPATEQGTCAARIRLVAKVGSRTVQVGKATVRNLTGGTTRTIKVRLKRSFAKRLHKRGRATVTIRSAVADSQGNTQTLRVRRRLRG